MMVQFDPGFGLWSLEDEDGGRLIDPSFQPRFNLELVDLLNREEITLHDLRDVEAQVHKVKRMGIDRLKRRYQLVIGDDFVLEVVPAREELTTK